MKRILKILLILLVPLIITSCSKKDYHEGELVELSGQELTNNFTGPNSKDFIFATVNEAQEGYREFLKDLEKYAEETNKAIYFIYYKHIDTGAALYIFNLFEADFTSNCYHVVEKGQVTLTNSYTDYNTMKEDLETKRFYALIDYTSEKEVKKNLEEAQKELDKGNIAISLNYINKIWNRKEAKDFYAKNPELGIIKSWEHFIISNDKRKKITYRSLLFHHDTKYFLEILTKEYYDVFEKPMDMSVYELSYYYLKDDIIYTSSKEDGTYKKRFKIMSVENTSFKLFDYKYNKEFTYNRRA